METINNVYELVKRFEFFRWFAPGDRNEVAEGCDAIAGCLNDVVDDINEHNLVRFPVDKTIDNNRAHTNDNDLKPTEEYWVPWTIHYFQDRCADHVNCLYPEGVEWYRHHFACILKLRCI